MHTGKKERRSEFEGKVIIFFFYLVNGQTYFPRTQHLQSGSGQSITRCLRRFQRILRGARVHYANYYMIITSKRDEKEMFAPSIFSNECFL